MEDNTSDRQGMQWWLTIEYYDGVLLMKVYGIYERQIYMSQTLREMQLWVGG